MNFVPEAHHFSVDDWVNTDLNYLLYRQGITPIFSSFEGNMNTNDSHWIDHFIDSNKFPICLDLNYITALTSDLRIMQTLSENIVILPSMSHSFSDYDSRRIDNYTKSLLKQTIIQNLLNVFFDLIFFTRSLASTKMPFFFV